MSRYQRVFVYGTLKRGGSNHYLLEGGHAKFIGEASTLTPIKMVSLGSFPALILDGEPKHKTPVKGEVYDVLSLGRLDVLEGYPEFYDRSIIQTSEGEAWAYHLKESEFGEHEDITSGVWNVERE